MKKEIIIGGGCLIGGFVSGVILCKKTFTDLISEKESLLMSKHYKEMENIQVRLKDLEIQKLNESN